MNKKLMAVAVAGALAAPAMVFAQASSVQIYGRLNAGLDNYEAKGASLPASAGGGLASRMRVYDSSSRLGFRGTEDLGNGLKAIFLIESGFNADNGTAQVGQGGQANTSTGFLASRVAHVGLDSSWGTLTFGRSNVWWGNGTIEQTAANYVNAGSPLFSGSFGQGLGVGITRYNNVMQYTSPTWNGFNTQISYSPNNQEGVQVTSSGAAGTADAKGNLWGITLQWAGGPFSVGYDWVKNTSNGTYTAASPTSAIQGSVTGQKLRAGWSYMPGAQISFLWVKSQVKNGGVAATGNANISVAALAAGSGATLSQSGWGLNWEHTFGNIQGLAQYARTGNVSGCEATAIGLFTAAVDGNATTSNCSQTRSTSWLVGARYLLSKRTAAYVTYNKTTNESHAFQDYTGGAITSNNGTSTTGGAANNIAGADPRVWAFGIIHNF